MDPVDIGSLLRLLKSLITPEQYRQLMLIIRELMENPNSVDVQIWGPNLLIWVRTYYPQLEGLIEAIIQRLTASAAAAEAGGGVAAGEAAGGLVLAELAAILALIAITAGALYLIYDELTTPPLLTKGGKACGSGPSAAAMARVKREVTVYAWGQRKAINKAIQAAQDLCDINKSACSGGCPKGQTCAPEAAILSVKTESFVVTTGATVTFVCPCTCH